MNDTDLAALVRGAMLDTCMTVPESDITRRARRLRTRRRVAAGGAAVAGLAAGLAVATLAAPASSPATGHAQNTAQLTGWTVTRDPSGVITVTIHELKDPAGLQTRLRADGVPINVSFSGPNPACHPYYPDYRFIPPMPPRYLGKAPKYPWINSYDNGSVTESITGPSALTLVLRPARMPRGTAFEIVALRGIVVAWGLVKTGPACTGLWWSQKRRPGWFDQPGLLSSVFRRCPTLPRGLPRSTIGAEGLNFRVRDGTGCFPFAMAAGNSMELSWPRWPPTVSREPHSGRETRSLQCFAGRNVWVCAKPLGLLVPVSCAPCGVSTSGLSTQSSGWGPYPVVPVGDLILRRASRLDAFSGYPFRT